MALASWQWWNHLETHIPPGKVPLRINTDETSICLFQGSGKGTIFVKKVKQKVSKSQKRKNLTLLSFVCDRADIQPHLPQVIIGTVVDKHMIV